MVNFIPSSFLPSSPPFRFLLVRIRRNLIGNQSFGGKNGVGLSITLPWVPAAERGGQKRRLMQQIVFPLLSLCLPAFVLTSSLTSFFLFLVFCHLGVQTCSKYLPKTIIVEQVMSGACVCVALKDDPVLCLYGDEDTLLVRFTS